MLDYAIKYWMGIGFAAIVSVGAYVCRKYRHKIKDMQCKYVAVELGMRAVLRTHIITTYNKYVEIGTIPIYELDNVDELFTQYKNLGGNGVILELVEKLKQLPQPNEKGIIGIVERQK